MTGREQPVGFSLPGWKPRARPPTTSMTGAWCRLERVDPPRHAEQLHRANSEDASGRMWTYLNYGPFESLASYRAWLEGVAGSEDPLYFAVISRDDERAVGVGAFLRIAAQDGCVEVGHLAFSPALQRTTAATEAIHLMMARVFDELGYRRFEWKCDALNGPSRAAATRFGFTYEGTFRHHMVVKSRNRDTAWFAITSDEGPRLRAAYERWLAPGNFEDGHQRLRLSELTATRAD